MEPSQETLAFTGERFVPGARGAIWIEHWHRYHFAARWAAGKRVLDVACGEGYGSALLAKTAAHVTGVDISEEAIAHAKGAYPAANLEFLRSACAPLPLPDASVEVAVSFETLEHIAEQEAFLAELARVLVPGGVLVLSCPNKLEYSDKRGYVNEFHVKELYREELEALVARHFAGYHWYGQRPTFYSVIAPEGGSSAHAQLVEVEERQPATATASLSHPLYFLLVASRDRASLAMPGPALSVLADRGDWVYRDYEKVFRDLEATAARAKALDAELADARRSPAQAPAPAPVRHDPMDAGPPPGPRWQGWGWWIRLALARLGLRDESL